MSRNFAFEHDPMMRFAGLAAVVSLLGGCAVTQPAYLANGQKVVHITCALAIDGMTTCFKKAGNICGPKGYVIFDWDGQPWARPYPNPDTLQGDPGLASSGLLVACGA